MDVYRHRHNNQLHGARTPVNKNKRKKRYSRSYPGHRSAEDTNIGEHWWGVLTKVSDKKQEEEQAPGAVRRALG